MGTDLLDHTLCQEMEKYVEELTTSGRPVLNPDIMKSFKKICKLSSVYCEHAYHLLKTQLGKSHSEIRLSAFQMIEELFDRSHCFRELLISDFQRFLELTVETDYNKPLPPPKTAADLLKKSAYSAVQKWNDKFGAEYKRLMLGFNFLKTCKKVDFNGIRARTEIQQRQEREIEEKKKKIAEDRMTKTRQEMNDLMDDVKNTITEVRTGFQLVLPAPDDFFIESAETDNNFSLPSTSKSSNQSSNSSDTKIISQNSEMCNMIQNNSRSDDINTNLTCEHILTNTKDSKVTPCENFNSDSKCEENDENVSLTSMGKSSSSTSCIENSKNVPCTSTSENQSSSRAIDIDKHTETNPRYNENNARTVDEDENHSDNEEECSSDDQDERSDEDDNVLQEHGMGNTKYNITIDVNPSRVIVKETEDNKDVLQVLKDQYRLIVTKYKPTVNKWLQSLTKYGNDEDMTKAVIDVKEQLDVLLSRYHEMNIIPKENYQKDDDDSEDDDFEDVAEKEGYEPAVIPPHKRAEYGLDAIETPSTSKIESKKGKQPVRTSGFWSLSKSIDQTMEGDPTTIKANLSHMQRKMGSFSLPSQEVKVKVENSKIYTGDAKKDKMFESAPVVPYGADLEHWENPDKMEAPLVIKYDSLHKFWAPNDFEEEQPDKEGLAAMKNRSISFVGKFEPVKWKCRAPMPNGKLCERMDRYKCPFHGKIIGRNDQGQPTDPKDIASLSKDDIDLSSNDQSYWRDPELEADIEAALGIDLGSKSGGKKGKGKGKAKKYPNLTDISEEKNTSRNRLEKKIFKRATMKRVAEAMNELDNKKAKDKFGNQFVYQMSQR